MFTSFLIFLVVFYVCHYIVKKRYRGDLIDAGLIVFVVYVISLAIVFTLAIGIIFSIVCTFNLP